MKMLSWILGIVSVLGIAGTITAFVLAPAIAMPVLQGIVARILSCRPCLYVLALIGVGIGAWWSGHHQAALECRAGELAAELRDQAADLKAARKSAADEAARATTIEDAANDQRSKDAAYIATLEARPACALDDLDLPGARPGGLRGGRKPRPGIAQPAAGAR